MLANYTTPPPKPRRATALITVGAKLSRRRPPRLYRLHSHPREYRRRIAALDAVSALEGVQLITLSPATPDPDPTAARLSVIPADFAHRVAQFVRTLSKSTHANYALRLCSRTRGGRWYPHLHGLISGVSRTRLEVIAARLDLQIHLETPANPAAAARYIAASHQAKHWDRSPGRTFWARANPPKE